MSNLPPDPWKTLGIDKTADKSEVRTAYRKLVLKCHPDKVQDPTLKAQKQDEFQKVQQAYELLNDDAERAKYEEQLKLAELRKAAMFSKNTANISVSRTPPRPSHTHSFYAEVRTVEREPRFRHASPHSPVAPSGAKVYANVYSSKSHDDDVSHRSQAAYEDDRRARRAASYEQPSRRDDEKREERRRRDAKERRDEEERDRERERERREKERTKQERREREKGRDKEKRRDVEDKTSRRTKDAYVEESHERDIREVYPPPLQPKVEKKRVSPSLSSSKKIEETREKLTSRRVRDESPRIQPDKHNYLKEEAAAYIERNRQKTKPAPSLGRSHTFQEPATYARVPSPPPTPAAYVDEDVVRRSSARPSRRSSHDMEARSQEKLYSPSQKKSREDIEVVDTSSRADRVAPSRAAERVVPMLHKSHTMPTQKVTPPVVPESPPRRPLRQNTAQEAYSRPPPPMPGMARAATFAGPGEKADRYPVIRGVYEPSDDELYEDDRRRHRARRARSPEPIKTRRYRAKDGMVTPVEPVYEADLYDHYEDHRSSRRHASSYGPGVADPDAGYYYATEAAAPFGKIKTSKAYTERDVQYGNWGSVQV